MGHEAAARAPIIQLYSNLPHTAVQAISITPPERVPHPPIGVNTPPKDYTIQPLADFRLRSQGSLGPPPDMPSAALTGSVRRVVALSLRRWSGHPSSQAHRPAMRPPKPLIYYL